MAVFISNDPNAILITREDLKQPITVLPRIEARLKYSVSSDVFENERQELMENGFGIVVPGTYCEGRPMPLPADPALTHSEMQIVDGQPTHVFVFRADKRDVSFQCRPRN